ncbi:hypothetical protein [Pseudonocardia acidicola]|uniref:Peptide chain release factor subunit 1 n=1 Tax=Pseudonocardia acidicola TaxID=2724939 RepID=A0ABX1S997_9PSEU|nr:hypothetical protein [Pseudonocardia acidicola]NMH96733.1 hypothetical protein [Pseudonocardia acidicola]
MLAVETVQRITEFTGDGLPVLTLYVRIDPADRAAYISQVDAMLHEVRGVAGNKDLPHEVRNSLRKDIERINEVRSEPQPRTLAVAYFSCSARGLFEQVELPRPVRDRVMIDETPWVRPMVAILDEYHRLRIAIVDRGSAHFWELYQDELADLGTLRDRTLRKPDFAYGDREYETHNKVELLARKHYRKVVDQLAPDARNGLFDLLAVGGHPEELPEFTDFFPRELEERFAGTFAVDPHTVTRGVIKEEAAPILEKWERDEERQLVSDILERRATGLPTALGLTECLWGGTTAAIDHLLVQEAAQAPGVVCDESRYLAEAGDTCPICGRPTRKTPDVIDELVQTVMDEGGRIEHVLAETPLQEHLVMGRLRFPLPPME